MNCYYYSDQARSNSACLFGDQEYKERSEVFLKICKIFKDKGVKWAVGCSMSLFFRGIVDEFHDLDLIVDREDIPVIKAIMDEIGAVLEGTGGNGFCESDVYLHYQVGRVDVDVIAGFRVNTYNTTYYYQFNEAEVDVVHLEEVGIDVPLIPLEAMYILYYMMEGWQARRRFKRKLIEQYFCQNSLIHREVFKNALEQNCLPEHIWWAVKVLS